MLRMRSTIFIAALVLAILWIASRRNEQLESVGSPPVPEIMTGPTLATPDVPAAHEPTRTSSGDRIVGQVLDETTGSIPNDVTVEIRRLESAQSRGVPIFTVQLSPLGEYTLERATLPSDGWIGIIARAPGYSDGTWFGEVKGLIDSAPTIELRPITFGRLAGRVVNETGVGLTGVDVSFEPTPGLGVGRTAMLAAGMTTATTTDSDGAFVFPRYPLNERDHVLVDGGPTRTLTVISEVAAGDDLAVPPVVLLPACAWTIQVLDKDRNPIGAACVETSPADDAVDRSLGRRLAELAAQNRRVVSAIRTGFGKQYTGTDGIARFQHVPLGQVEVTVQIGNADATRTVVGLVKSVEHTEVILGPDSQPDLVVNVVNESGNSITNFFGIDGDDWPGLEQKIRAETGARADALALDVRVRVIDATGTREFVLDSKNFPTLSIPVSALAFPVDVELWLGAKRFEARHFQDRPGAVTFRLSEDDMLEYVRSQCGFVRFAVVGDDGAVARRVSAIFHRLEDNDLRAPSHGFCFPGNNYMNGEPYAVPSGAGVVAIAAAGSGRATVAFNVLAGQFLDLGDLRLSAGGSLDIEVTRTSGSEAAATNATVSIIEVPTGDPVLLVPDVFRVGTHVAVDIPPGKLKLNAIAAGDYLVRVASLVGAVKEVSTKVEAGKTTSVQIDL